MAFLRALSKNPKDRFSSCAEFVAALGEASSPSEQPHPHTQARPEVSLHQTEPQKKSGKGWLVAVLLALVAGGGVWFAIEKRGGATSPSEPQQIGAREISSATQDGAAGYERRIAEERKKRETDLHMDGVYWHKKENYIEYLRFYPNGVVISASVNMTKGQPKVLPWFTQNSDSVSKGTYRINGSSLDFSSGDVDYWGIIQSDRSLLLN